MNSTAASPKPDTLVVTMPTPLPTAHPQTPHRPAGVAAGLARRLRWLVAVVVGLLAVMAVPGTALAHTDPIRPDSGSVPAVAPAPYLPVAAHPAASGWGLTSAIGVVALAVLVIALLVVAQRVAAGRRAARPTTAHS